MKERIVRLRDADGDDYGNVEEILKGCSKPLVMWLIRKIVMIATPQYIQHKLKFAIQLTTIATVN